MLRDPFYNDIIDRLNKTLNRMALPPFSDVSQRFLRFLAE